ncbi:hypothetical protein V8E51_013553 [Hyaloscypha variabilis]
MASLSSIKAALGSFQNQNALANINFDFSLVKVDAPPEFMRFESQEISESLTITDSDLDRARIFEEHLGFDGTAIWAAATSGKDAISLIMLACMLTKIWSQPEATSLWQDLVEERRKEIHATCDGSSPSHFAILAAAQQIISRSELADWNASICAWIQTADQAMLKKQKQLELIINNIHLPISNSMSAYSSILNAWKTASYAMEKLVQGMPQAGENGAIFLGLSCWHLYPDLVVINENATEIHQDDKLITPGGIFTIGLQNRAPEGSDGVYWSLPLAHLRYYGEPVNAVRTVGKDASRIPFDGVISVALGSMVCQWDSGVVDNIAALQWFAALLEFLAHFASSKQELQMFTEDSWITALLGHAQRLLDLPELDQAMELRLMGMGRRRCHKMLANNHPPRGFGLCKPTTLFQMLQSGKDPVEFLRKVASDLPQKCGNLVIRYNYHGYTEYASAVPWRTFVESPNGVSLQLDKAVVLEYLNRPVESLSTRSHELHNRGEDCFLNIWDEQDRSTQKSMALWTEGIKDLKGQISTMFRSNCHIQFGSPPWEEFAERTSAFPKLESLFGPLDSVSLLRIESQLRSASIGEQLPLKTVTSLLLEKKLNFDKLYGFLRDLTTSAKDYFTSLKAIASAATIYKRMPHATISIEMTTLNIHKSLWITNSKHGWALEKMPLTNTFACITMFESGIYNISPELLKGTMAISSGNSIFAAASLLCDPADMPQTYDVVRLLGNIGRAGIAMLVPPPKPRIRVLEPNSWNCVNHHPFDGNLEDSFKATTIHLSFTKYEFPIDVGARGAQDSNIFFIESLISVYDRGIWVADLDILSSLKSRHFRCLPGNCGHQREKLPSFPLTSIDNWEEVLDRDGRAIFRARGNKIARLAATSIAIQQGHCTMVLPDSFCWFCCSREIRRMGLESLPQSPDIFIA